MALTHEEHQARAMLLGMVYDWRDHSYGVMGQTGQPALFSDDNGNASYVLDADTLEKVFIDEANKRLGGKSHLDWKVYPND